MMRKILCAVALLVPTLILGVVVAQRLNELETAPVVRLPIAGYDPVDILHGHYLRLRFDDRAFAKNPNYYEMAAGEYCACFNPSSPQAVKGGTPVVGEYVQCKKKTEMQCELWASNAKFFNDPQKFFVDERYALQLDKLVRDAAPRPAPRRNARPGNIPNTNMNTPPTPAQPPELETSPRVTMDVAISKSGAMRLKMLYIDNKPWREVISTR